jgi:hypothetical protein
MSQAKEKKKSPGRRTFLAGLVTGAGAVAALSAAPRTDAAKHDERKDAATKADPVLYRRTEETNRYYRTLYR